MSTVHDTTKLKPYILNNSPKLDASLLVFITTELRTISASLNATQVALKSIEARIVAGGL